MKYSTGCLIESRGTGSCRLLFLLLIPNQILRMITELLNDETGMRILD